MPNSSDSGTGNRRLAAVIRLCLLCLIFIDGITPTTHVTVTHCDIAPGSLTDPTQITCNFPWDLNQTQQSFVVYRYEPNGHEKVLVCFWSSGRFVCNQKDGFKAPEVVSYQFNTTIPNEEDTEFGCDVYPPDFTTEVRRCRCPKRSASEKVEVTESTPETKCKEHTEKNAVEYHIVIILLVLLSLFTLCICIVRVLWRRLHRTRNTAEVMSYQAETVSLTQSRTEQTPIEEVQTAESEPEQFIEFNDVKELTLECQARLLNEKDTEKSPDATETCVQKCLKTNEKMPYSKDQICHILPTQLVKRRLTVHPGGVASSSAKGWIRIISNSGKEKTLRVTGIYPATTDISLHGLPEQASVYHEKEAYRKPIQEEHHQVRELTTRTENTDAEKNIFPSPPAEACRAERAASVYDV